jgi:hypothetical protein
MVAYGGMELKLYVFLETVLALEEWSVLSFGRIFVWGKIVHFLTNRNESLAL